MAEVPTLRPLRVRAVFQTGLAPRPVHRPMSPEYTSRRAWESDPHPRVPSAFKAAPGPHPGCSPVFEKVARAKRWAAKDGSRTRTSGPWTGALPIELHPQRAGGDDHATRTARDSGRWRSRPPDPFRFALFSKQAWHPGQFTFQIHG